MNARKWIFLTISYNKGNTLYIPRPVKIKSWVDSELDLFQISISMSYVPRPFMNISVGSAVEWRLSNVHSDCTKRWWIVGPFAYQWTICRRRRHTTVPELLCSASLCESRIGRVKFWSVLLIQYLLATLVADKWYEHSACKKMHRKSHPETPRSADPTYISGIDLVCLKVSFIAPFPPSGGAKGKIPCLLWLIVGARMLLSRMQTIEIHLKGLGIPFREVGSKDEFTFMSKSTVPIRLDWLASKIFS